MEPQATDIVIGGKSIHPGPDGIFEIPHMLLRSGTLSQMPPGTQITVTYPGEEGRSLKTQVRVTNLEVLGQGRVRVAANLFRCSCCWEHAMSFMKYTEGVMLLFANEAAINKNFQVVAVEVTEAGTPIHCITIEHENGSFTDMETTVKDTVMQVLKPLNDLRDAFDGQVFKQLGI
jgi:hypothetical protein